jgi:hypothetical protein
MNAQWHTNMRRDCLGSDLFRLASCLPIVNKNRANRVPTRLQQVGAGC